MLPFGECNEIAAKADRAGALMGKFGEGQQPVEP